MKIELFKEICIHFGTERTDNRIGNEGVAKICELLVSNTTLTELDLTGDNNN